VSKKHIIIMIAGGLLSFAVAFGVMWILGKKNQSAASVASSTQPDANATLSTTGAETTPIVTQASEEALSRTLSQKQLKSLIYEVREKIREYEGKMKELESREERLAVTQETLKKDIEELNRLRVEMAAMAANLKEQRNRLLDAKAQIAQSEKANLTGIAATYDKMDPSSASKLISSMCTKQMETGRIQGGTIDDAVKILYFMTERTKAKLLAEMVTTEPKLAAVLCQRLKEVVEGPASP
jgi:flagellar motility protein MotE (MotC chaperone)